MNKAIVTGASSGIGKAICRQLAANGWLVYGIGRSFNQSDDIAGIERIVCDITDTAKLIKTIKEINKNHDISLLINNAGVGFYALHEELNPVKISQMVRTNLEAPMIITNLLLRDLKKNKGYRLSWVSFVFCNLAISEWVPVWASKKKKPCKFLSYKAFCLSFVVPPATES